MQLDNKTVDASQKMLWVGRIGSALPVLFLLVDGAMKLAKPEIVVKTTVTLGYTEAVFASGDCAAESCFQSSSAFCSGED